MRTAAALLAALLAAAIPSSASAGSEGQLGLSRDGVHYGDALTRPLFDPAVRWVPGDERTARFWVRNQSADLGDLTVQVVRAPRDALLETGHLEVAARIGAQEYTSIDAPGTHDLIDEEDVAAGTEIAVDVRVQLAAEAPNDTMLLGADLDFTVTLTGSTGGGNGDQTPGGDLPGTGSDVAPWLAPVAAALVLGGVLLARRRPRPNH